MDHYGQLGVPPTATANEIKGAFRKLALQYHPDRHVNSSAAVRLAAANKFKAITEAYEVLEDEHKRAGYNLSRAQNATRGATSYAYRHTNTDWTYSYRRPQTRYDNAGPFAGYSNLWQQMLRAGRRGLGGVQTVAYSGAAFIALSTLAMLDLASRSVWKHKNEGKQFKPAEHPVRPHRSSKPTPGQSSALEASARQHTAQAAVAPANSLHAVVQPTLHLSPASSTNQPGSSQQQPGISEARPKAKVDLHDTRGSLPASLEQTPAAAGLSAAHQQPTAVTQQPTAGTQHTTRADQQPTTAASQHAAANSLRPPEALPGRPSNGPQPALATDGHRGGPPTSAVTPLLHATDGGNAMHQGGAVDASTSGTPSSSNQEPTGITPHLGISASPENINSVQKALGNASMSSPSDARTSTPSDVMTPSHQGETLGQASRTSGYVQKGIVLPVPNPAGQMAGHGFSTEQQHARAQ